MIDVKELMAKAVSDVIQVEEVFGPTMSSPQLVEEEGQI